MKHIPAESVSPVWERQVDARSVSRPAWDRLTDTGPRLEVLAVFHRACLLKTRTRVATGESTVSVLALVLPDIGDGPLNIVLDEHASAWTGIQAGQTVCLRGDSLCIGSLRVSFKQTSIWEPRPDWDQLRSRDDSVRKRLEMVASLARQHASSESMLALLNPTVAAAAAKPPTCKYLAAARRGMSALEAGWPRQSGTLQEGISQLAGLGPGLTPAGDDFLAGAMYSLWLCHPTPLAACGRVVQIAAPRTTLLSAALLQRAAAGECIADWQRLLHDIASGDRQRLEDSIRAVLGHGHTSGADTLCGFLWSSRLQLGRQSARSGRVSDPHFL